MVPILSFLVLLLLLYFFSPRPASAQARPGSSDTAQVNGSGYDHATMAPFIVAMPMMGEITIDGVLSEPAWSSAEAYSRFTQREPDERQPAPGRRGMVRRMEDPVLTAALRWKRGRRMRTPDRASHRAEAGIGRLRIHAAK